MEVWIAVAALCVLVCSGGIAALGHQYRQGRVRGVQVGVVLGAYALLVAILVVSKVAWSRPVGSFFVILMMPLWALIALWGRRRDEK